MAARRDPDREAFNAAVAGNLRRLVAGDGRSMREIERDCGIAQNTVGKMTRGVGMSLITAVRLCECLCCTMDDLTDGAGSMIKARPWLKGPGR